VTVSDETLMAYADGETDAATRAIVEAAMRDDPEVRRRVAHHQALREAVKGAFAAVIDEPVPRRLIAAARGAPAGNVVDLAGARDAAAINAPRRPLSWQPAAMAASLLLGLALGYLGWHGSNTLVTVGANGELVAGAGLAAALSSQLSADHPPGTVATTGLSFRTKIGDYCRTFALTATHPNSGLACREGNSWKVKVLAQSPETTANSSGFRPAASADSAAVRAAVEESIEGEPLDQAGEIAARRGDWSRP
jgi:anti-sigma factor RsiW